MGAAQVLALAALKYNQLDAVTGGRSWVLGREAGLRSAAGRRRLPQMSRRRSPVSWPACP